MGRISAAIKAFWQILLGGTTPAISDEKTTPETAPQPVSTQNEFEAGAVYTLLLMQRAGRLIDFLQEDISQFNDAQIGAAVRQIHEGSRKVLEENFGIQSVASVTEGQPIEVPEGFDPSVYKLTGNVPSAAPYNGSLVHKGWKAENLHFPQRTGKNDATVICPAEVNF